ncbi:MAG TPA: S8 family serine peptidase [Gemmatimonadaceae bacterium]|nr:S8 family serine peptidase [Gemmatimonadaceae bacterium]
MHARVIAPILLPLATLLFQGCDRGTIPTESSPQKGVVALAVGTHSPDHHVVVFASAQVPGTFEEQVAAFGGVVERVVGAAGLAVVSGLAEDALGALRAESDVLSVEPDVVLEPAVELTLGADASEHAEVGIESHGEPMGAAYFSRQWNLRAIGADAAWAQGHLGSPEVVVGILDSGIDYLHPELEGRVDLSRSISLVPALDAQVATLFPGRHPVTDLNSHGTAMAGLIVSNAHLLAGVSQRTTVFGVKVHDGIDGGLVSTFIAGIVYAVEQGADVIHLSGVGQFSKSAHPGLVAAVNRAVNLANRSGAVLVAPAGNTGAALNVVGGPGDWDHDEDRFGFCVAPHVICVSATAPTAAASLDGPWTDVDAVAPYSNFGHSAIAVAAPGGAPLQRLGPAGGVWVLCALTTQVQVPNVQFPCRRGAGLLVTSSSGTSWSAGTTSGLAALLVAQIGKGKPAQIRTRILQTADDIGEPGTDARYGTGRINVGRALGAVP